MRSEQSCFAAVALFCGSRAEDAQGVCVDHVKTWEGLAVIVPVTGAESNV